MKKILFSLVLLSLLVSPVMANASVSWSELKGGIKTGMWRIFAVVVIVMFVWSAIMFLTAQGEPDKLSKAKSAFMYGVIAVVIGLVAYSMVNIVEGLMGL